jgi:hypothetical protein
MTTDPVERATTGAYAASVRDFGATGDGRADDTDAIQRALAAGAGEVYFPQGDYRITRTVEVALARPCCAARGHAWCITGPGRPCSSAERTAPPPRRPS